MITSVADVSLGGDLADFSEEAQDVFGPTRNAAEKEAVQAIANFASACGDEADTAAPPSPGINANSPTESETPGHDDSSFIRTQEDVCRQFLPTLKDRGRLIKKQGRRLARPANVGEEVLTMINGTVIAKTVVTDPSSMVVRQESADFELYVLDAVKFAKNYCTDGVPIVEADPAFEELRERGFMFHERKGQLRIYQVAERDMEFFPAGKFEVSFSIIPQPVRKGDYLVTVWPEAEEVYVSPHISIYNDDGQAPLSGLRTQEEMCQHFLPIIRDKGKVVQKSGRRLARLAKKGEEVLTVIDGEITARKVIADDDSMVIRQESADNEVYALDREKFKLNYAGDGVEIDVASEPRLEEFCERGFKSYERIGELMIYRVTDDDMKFVPAGKFQVSFSTIPQPLREGDLLVTTLPEMKEVYMTRHATVYNDDGQLFQPRGVVSQEDMLWHFLPIMRERGVRMRRAGWRLARHAKKGERVRTIVNTEVVSEQVVQDDTSMVVQEESTDREEYALRREKFEELYGSVGTDITGVGHDADALKARGFRYYEKSGGMVLMYLVQEDDMQFVPGGRFQVPFSVIPMPLRAGDYLLTRSPEEDAIYMSRNADQIFFSRENLEVHYVFASPLTHESLSLDSELEGLRTSGAIVRLTCAKSENLTLLKKAWCGSAPTVLHISCHTASDENAEARIVMEDDAGCGFQVPASRFLDLVIGGGPAPEVVVVSSCSSQSWAAGFLERGVRRTVAVRDGAAILDRAASHFATAFYGELRSNRSVETAFKIAIESMRAAQEPGIPAEAEKLILLKDDDLSDLHLGADVTRRGLKLERGASVDALDLEPYIAVPLPFGAGEAGHIGPLVYPRSALPRKGGGGVVQDHIPNSRRAFLIKTLNSFTKFRVLKLCGPEGTGKAHFAGLLANFAALPGGRLFSGGVVVLNRSADGGVMSQERMCERFLPILKEKGILVRKEGTRLARPAEKGEEVMTIINGRVIAKVVVQDDTSMVIRQESSDHELYVLPYDKFEINYEVPGKLLQGSGHEFDAMRERGFKYYDRKGVLMIYRVTEEDMKHVPGSRFEVSFSTIPQPLQVGDYLVTVYPDCKEVYVSRNAEQIYSSQIIRSQDEMLGHFLTHLKKSGRLMRRVGYWFARPARKEEEIVTIINGEVVSKMAVVDESSMVVHTESCDGEWYALSEQEFLNSYELPGIEISEKGQDFDTWRGRGFKRYKRKGMVRIYRVTRGDLEFLPGGQFWGKTGGGQPQRLKVGDHLVTDYPEMEQIYMCRNAQQVFEAIPKSEIVRSQSEMVDHFIPIMRQRGMVMAKTGVRAARPAVRGEKIRTMIDAEVVAKAEAKENTSMVVMKNTLDRELALLSAKKFEQNYVNEAMGIETQDKQSDALRARGFKHYQRKGQALVYRVTDEDVSFVSGGLFYVSFSTIPQPLRVGDRLVAPLPACDEVYLNRNASECYDRLDEDVDLSTGTARSSRAPSPVITDNANLKTPGFVNQLRAVVSAHSSDAHGPLMGATLSCATRPMDPGLRAQAELEDALCAAASHQAALAARWYPTQHSTEVSRQPSRPEATEAEVAVEKWLAAIPKSPQSPNGRALLVLIDGAKFLTHEATRETLRQLLRRNPALHLLVTVTTPPRKDVDSLEAKAARAAMLQAPAPLDSQINELPNLIPMSRLADREVAEVFFTAMMRSQQGRPLCKLLAKLGRQESVARLEKHSVIQACEGVPGAALREAETVESSVTTLEEWRPSKVNVPVSSP